MADKIKIAVVGAGYWGKNLIRNFQALGVLDLICDVRKETLKPYSHLRRVTGSWDAVLADSNLTAVAIATPAETHYQLVKDALQAGKHVFVEKPLALTEEEGAHLHELAKAQNKVLMVGHLLQYHPAIIKLKELVLKGELGKIQYIYSNRLNLGKVRNEENILWSFAPHDISVILSLVGEMPDSVTSFGGSYLQEGIADVTISNLSFPSGIKAHIFVSWLHPYKEQRLVIVGDKKMALFNDVEPVDKLLLYPHSIEWKNRMPVFDKKDAEIIPIESKEPLLEECTHFVGCVTRNVRPRTDSQEGLKVLKVLQQCQASLEQARTQVNETAIIDSGCEIGEGTKIWHFSHVIKGSKIGKDCKIGQNVVIGPNVKIGNQVKIQNNVSVYEGVTLEDGVFCGPSMVFTNVHNPRSYIPRMDEIRPTLVKEGASLGANCTILGGVTIGRFAFVGAGAVVLQDVPDYGMVVGNPAKLMGHMCSCGERLNSHDYICASCGIQQEVSFDSEK